MPNGLTRRRLLGAAGAAGVGFGAGGFLVGTETARREADGTGTVPFYGEHQAGIATPPRTASTSPPSTWSTETRRELRELMRRVVARRRRR